jgi:crossover junction endodeoxyribonuclease RuvC
MGIDLSVTATGIVVLQPEETPTPSLIHAEEISFKKLIGLQRQRSILSEVMLRIAKFGPNVIVLEGYSLNMRNANSVIPLVEIGGMLRLMFSLDGLNWFEPKASELKKFVTGKGNSQKDVVMMSVLKRWGYESATNNIADAYTLAAMGLSHANQLMGVTKEMRAIAGSMVKRSN